MLCAIVVVVAAFVAVGTAQYTINPAATGRVFTGLYIRGTTSVSSAFEVTLMRKLIEDTNTRRK
jgi:hypothetical protein